jgi:hypothetical protein
MKVTHVIEICSRFVRTWTLHERTMTIPRKDFCTFQSVTLSCNTQKPLQLAITWKVFSLNICCFRVLFIARWRLSPEMTSPFYSPTRFPKMVRWHFSPLCDCFRIFCENVNSAARWCPRPGMTSPFDSPTPISYKWSVDIFRLSSSVQKLLTHFDFLLGKYVSGNLRENCSPSFKFWHFLTLYHILLADLHQSGCCLFESIAFLKSYAMEYFGWETPFAIVKYSLKITGPRTRN